MVRISDKWVGAISTVISDRLVKSAGFLMIKIIFINDECLSDYLINQLNCIQVVIFTF